MCEDVLQNNRGTGEVADKWCKKMQKTIVIVGDSLISGTDEYCFLNKGRKVKVQPFSRFNHKGYV